MPPLCTAGYGLATAQWNYFFGAFYLFFINTVFIALSTFLGVKLLRFHNLASLSPEMAKRGRRLMVAVVVVTMIPAALMTIGIVKKNIFQQNVGAFVDNELAQNGTQILSREAVHDTLRVVAIGRTIGDREIEIAQRNMHHYGLEDYTLVVIQGTDSEDLELLTNKLANRTTAAENANSQLLMQVASLEKRLEAYSSYDTLSVHVNAEAKALFPQIKEVAVGRMAGTTTVIVTLQNEKRMEGDGMLRLIEWIKTRTSDPKTDIIIR